MRRAGLRVVGLAGVLVFGSVSLANALQIKVDEDSYIGLEVKMKTWFLRLDERGQGERGHFTGWKRNVFSVGNAKISFEGQLKPFFQFYSEFDSSSSCPVYLREGGVNLAFSKELQVLMGLIRKPFTRAQLTDSYNMIVASGFLVDMQNLLIPLRQTLRSADGGVMVHGDLAGGMFRYRVGVFNEDRSNMTKYWDGRGWRGIIYIDKANDKKGFEWNVRVEFTPTMFGFKPEPAGTITSRIADTYLGTRDVLTIGLGYHTEAHTSKARIGGQVVDELRRRGWTVDAMFEKKFGALVPNLQIGYISLDKTHFYKDYEMNGVKEGGANILYTTGQLLYDRVVGLGKPAVAFRYEKMVADGQGAVGSVVKKDLTAETFGLAFNYYIKGQAARVSLGAVQAKYKDAAEHSLLLKGGRDKITDYYLYFQLQF